MRFAKLASIAFGLAVSTGTAVGAALPAGQPDRAGETITITITAAGGSSVSGNATLSEHGATTHVALTIRGLAPGANVRAALHSGTCEHRGANHAAIGSAHADPAGLAHWEADILLHGIPVSWAVATDGAHVISIVSAKHLVACGAVLAVI